MIEYFRALNAKLIHDADYTSFEWGLYIYRPQASEKVSNKVTKYRTKYCRLTLQKCELILIYDILSVINSSLMKQ